MSTVFVDTAALWAPQACSRHFEHPWPLSESVSRCSGRINRTGDNRAYCCHFLLFCSTSLLGELNKTGQFCVFFKCSGFYPYRPQRFSFFIYFAAGFNLPHPQNNIFYTVAFERKEKKKRKRVKKGFQLTLPP